MSVGRPYRGHGRTEECRTGQPEEVRVPGRPVTSTDLEREDGLVRDDGTKGTTAIVVKGQYSILSSKTPTEGNLASRRRVLDSFGRTPGPGRTHSGIL